ncbi:hypothetical protein [Polaribacter sp.]|uniref:hypothetical protein n=1 Tax=Polaribacter sp. TaxID=1920175 RepID=UPI003EF927A6
MDKINFFNLFDNITEDFVNKFGDLDGINYLAIKQSFIGNYKIELGYEKAKVEKETLKKIKIYMVSKLPKSSNYFSIPRILNTKIRQIFNYTTKTLKSGFDYNDTQDNDELISDYLIYNVDNPLKKGSLGGIFSIQDNNDFYLISNHHVINGELGSKIKNTQKKNNIIGTLYWQKFDSRINSNRVIGKYDVAIAKITNKTYFPNNFEYKFNHKNLIETTFKIKNIKANGAKSGVEPGKLYSIKALVKVENDWYNNQILITDCDLYKGDSGALITDVDNNVLGLYIGGSSQIKVANNLFNLFKETVNSNPKISLKNFY